MKKRLSGLRKMMLDKELDGLFISSPANRRYISGFTGTAGYVLITRERDIFITDFRYVRQAEQQCPGFTVVEFPKDFLEGLYGLLKEMEIGRLGFEDGHVTCMQYSRMKDKLEGIELRPVGEAVNNMRMIKDGQELEAIREATRIAEQAFEHIMSFIKPGIKEREVSLELEFYMRRAGISAPSFDFIVASGWRSALPHGVAGDKRIEEGEFVTLDFGGVYNGYCSDMTRTVAVGGYSPKQREIYDVVLKAQLTSLERVRAGMTGIRADKTARDIIEEAGYGEYFGHGLGHGVGLLVHEAPTLSTKGDITLQPGMVVSIEPGIYIPGFGGVRIEDLIVITEEGIENLNNASKELIVL